MNTLRIGTWNIKKSCYNLTRDAYRASAVKELLVDKNLDVLALQEVNANLFSSLNDSLKGSDYHLDRCFENGVTLLPNIFGKYNITIIKNNFLNNCDTIKLSAYPYESVSRIEIKEENMGNTFLVYNTRLHNQEDVAVRQAKKLGEIVSWESKRCATVVLTSTNIRPLTVEMGKLKKVIMPNNYLRFVEVGGRTDQKNFIDAPVDHIFASDIFEFEDTEVIKNYADVANHFPVITKLKVR